MEGDARRGGVVDSRRGQQLEEEMVSYTCVF